MVKFVVNSHKIFLFLRRESLLLAGLLGAKIPFRRQSVNGEVYYLLHNTLGFILIEAEGDIFFFFFFIPEKKYFFFFLAAP